MVNPSIADGRQDDPTIRRWLGFASRLGWGGITIVNKFAWRSPQVESLTRATDPIGPENDRHIAVAVAGADAVIVAWGSLSKLPPSLQARWRTVAQICADQGVQMTCWGTTSDGHPKHPLMISYSSELRPWVAPRN